MQSLTGSLAFCCKALPSGRAFSRRFYSSMSAASKPFHFIRVSSSLKEDAKMWLYFLNNFNRVQIFPRTEWLDSTVLQLFTDSSRIGCGAFLHNKWAYIKWPRYWDPQVLCDMTFLELIPVVMAIFVWGNSHLKNKRLHLHTDNEALVSVLNSKTSKSPRVMTLVRPLVLKLLHLNINVRSSHIMGTSNEISDAISRLQWDRFRLLAPQAQAHPYTIPQDFWTLFHQL